MGNRSDALYAGSASTNMSDGTNDPVNGPRIARPSVLDAIASRLTQFSLIASVRRRKRRRSLVNLPPDVLLNIFGLLCVSDVVSLYQTCRDLYTVSASASLWIDIIAWYLRRGRILALDSLTSIPDIYSDPATLRRVVLRTDRLERNWRSPRPKAITSEASMTLPIKQEPQRRDLSSFSFISEEILLVYWCGRMGFDLYGISCLGNVKYEGWRRIGFLSLPKRSEAYVMRVDHPRRQIYALTSTRASFVKDREYHIRRILLPSPTKDSTLSAEFELLGQFKLPGLWKPLMLEIDFVRRWIVILFITQEYPMRLCVWSDWGSGPHVIIDTSIQYVSTLYFL